MNDEGRQILSLKQIKRLSIFTLVLVGGPSFFSNEAITHHTAEDGDAKKRIATLKESK